MMRASRAVLTGTSCLGHEMSVFLHGLLHLVGDKLGRVPVPWFHPVFPVS